MPSEAATFALSDMRGRDDTRKARRDSAAMAAWLTVVSALFWTVVGVLACDLFKIERVEIDCPQPSIAEEAAMRAETVSYGNIWLLPTRDIERLIGGLPRVKDVRLRRVLPRTLVITVQPRTPAAALACQGRSMLVDAEGVCLTWTGQPPEHLPTVRTSALDSLRVGRLMPTWEAALLAQVLRGLHEVKLSPGARVDLTNPHLVCVWTADGVLGKLGDGHHLEEKMILFGKLRKVIQARGEQPLYIDMRVPSLPTYRLVK